MSEEKRKELEKTEKQNEQIEDMGQLDLSDNEKQYHIHLLSIIGAVSYTHLTLPTTPYV